jgi:hypothetical protein
VDQNKKEMQQHTNDRKQAPAICKNHLLLKKFVHSSSQAAAYAGDGAYGVGAGTNMRKVAEVF